MKEEENIAHEASSSIKFCVIALAQVWFVTLKAIGKLDLPWVVVLLPTIGIIVISVIPTIIAAFWMKKIDDTARAIKSEKWNKEFSILEEQINGKT